MSVADATNAYGAEKLNAPIHGTAIKGLIRVHGYLDVDVALIQCVLSAVH